MNEASLQELKIAMEALEHNKQTLKIKQDVFNEENRQILNSIKLCNEKIIEQKEILTFEALQTFEDDLNKNKKLLGGIGIRVLKQLNYDKLVALNWAKEKDLFLQLDTKAFENVAKTGELDFVEITDKITVTFPKEILI